jgi:hypothetical protein
MDGRRFRTEPWNGEYENPEGFSSRRIVLSGRPFLFGDFFLWASKEKACPELVEGSLGRGSGRKPSLSRKPTATSMDPRFRGDDERKAKSLDPRPAEGRPVLSLPKGGDDD